MKLVTQDINFAAGQSGPKTIPIPFDKGYLVKGVMFEKFAGGPDLVKIEFRNSKGSLLIDPLSINFLLKGNEGFKADTAVPFPPGVGTTNDLRANLFFENLSADYSGELLFILEKERDEADAVNNHDVVEFVKLGQSGPTC